MNIMIVDDEKDIGFILNFELQSLGHQTSFFSSAKEACEYLKTETPDAIVCDFQMPVMNGIELFNWLKAQNRDIPFYILTGELNMDADELYSSGVKNILFKPQDLLKLAEIFNE
jgi:CheY-like chemotaxis protein